MYPLFFYLLGTLASESVEIQIKNALSNFLSKFIFFIKNDIINIYEKKEGYRL